MSRLNPCPVCSALPGEPCHSKRGYLMGYLHQNRADEAAAEWAAKYDRRYRELPSAQQFRVQPSRPRRYPRTRIDAAATTLVASKQYLTAAWERNRTGSRD